MLKLNLRLVLSCLCLLVATLVTAQEICNNGIDDDGDSLVDLNDDDCACTNIVPLDTMIGSACRTMLFQLELSEAISYQWYHDGIAIPGQIYSLYSYNSFINDPGEYAVLIETPTGCVMSDPVDLRPEEYFIDLGERFLCNGDTLEIGGAKFWTSGLQNVTTQALNGCDSIIQVDILVANERVIDISDQMCRGGTFEFGDTTLSSVGVYFDTLSTISGCDSIVRLNLTELPERFRYEDREICAGDIYTEYDIVADEAGEYRTNLTAGECDTTLVINLSIVEPDDEYRPVSICTGSSYTLGGLTVDQPGIYPVTLVGSDGCDSLNVEVDLILEPVLTSSIEASICEGLTYIFRDIEESTSGIYTTYSELGECDTLITVELTVTPPDEIPDPQEICRGESIEWKGSTYFEEGSYPVQESIAGQCDVIHILELSIREVDEEYRPERICQGGTFTLGDLTADQEGLHFVTLQGEDGCDSLDVAVDLSFEPVLERYMSASICEGLTYTYRDIEESTSGIYTTYSELGDCDTLITVELTVTPPDEIPDPQEICRGESIEWRGNTYAEEGSYPVLESVSGECDVIHVLELSIRNPDEEYRPVSICTGSSYTLGGLTTDEPGLHFVTLQGADGCDSLDVEVELSLEPVIERTMTATICQGQMYTYRDIEESTSGTYTTYSELGECDTLITVELSVTPPDEIPDPQEICRGESIEWRGNTYAEEGSYPVLESVSGECDVIHVLELSIRNPDEEYRPVSICTGSSYTLGDLTTDEPGTHLVTLQGTDGCDSLDVELDLALEPVLERSMSATICEGLTYTYRDIEESTSGIYTTYSEIGDCDTLITIELIVTPPQEIVEAQSICRGESFEWRGNTYDTSDTYSIRESEAGECDVIHVLNLDVVEPDPILEYPVICAGEVYEIGGQRINTAGLHEVEIAEPGACVELYHVYLTVNPVTRGRVESVLCNGDTFTLFDLTTNMAGTYEAHTTNEFGCDSIIDVLLLANLLQETIVDREICIGEETEFFGEFYSEEGKFTHTLENQYGCDSLVTLDLKIRTVVEASREEVICFGETFEYFDINANTTGTYSTPIAISGGCDSLITINLRVREQPLDDEVIEICEGDIYDYNGIILSEEESREVVLSNQYGCDSIVALTVIVHRDVPTTLNVDICEGEVYANQGIYATESGRYEDVIQTAGLGCDSTIIVDVNVLPLNRRSNEVLICAGESVDFYGREIFDSGSYTERFSSSIGCDSVVTLLVNVDNTAGDVELEPGYLVNIGSEVDIEPLYVDENFYFFEWADEDGNILGTDEQLLGYLPLDDTYVDFTAINLNGCEVTRRTRIDVELIVNIFIPNVIVPHLQNYDSYFNIRANESVIGMPELYIYDRWGELVYTDSHDGRLDDYLGWDGVYKNKPSMEGVYTYYAVFEIRDGSFVKKAGDLTILR